MFIMHHNSVLLHEAINALNINPSGIYIDGTFGLGGHSHYILSKLTSHGRLIAMDRDWSAVNIGEVLTKQDGRFSIIHAPFSKMLRCIYNMNLVGLINGILLDLGVCESQLTDSSRGFSFMRDGPLDMRMDNSVGQSAYEWIAKASQKDIEWVLRTFGEEKLSKKIARSIVLKREVYPIDRTSALSEIISDTVLYYNNRYNRRKHPATRSFLAIRIYINEELVEIMKILQDVFKLLAPGGRLVVISFNSLEDRIVKKFINQYSRVFVYPPKIPLTHTQLLHKYSGTMKFKNLGKIKPTVLEIKKNIRARSAILRYAEKLIYM